MNSKKRKMGRPSNVPDVKKVIRDAALQLFGERGFEATSIGDIATKAGVPKANVLYHFGSKDDLWREAVEAMYSELDDYYAEYWPRGSEAASLEGLEQTMRVYFEAVRRWPAHVQIHNLEGNSDNWRMRWLAERHLRRHIVTARKYFHRLVDAGVLPDVEPLFFQILFGGGGQLLLGQYHLWNTATQQQSSIEEFSQMYVSNFMEFLQKS